MKKESLAAISMLGAMSALATAGTGGRFQRTMKSFESTIPVKQRQLRRKKQLREKAARRRNRA